MCLHVEIAFLYDKYTWRIHPLNCVNVHCVFIIMRCFLIYCLIFPLLVLSQFVFDLLKWTRNDTHLVLVGRLLCTTVVGRRRTKDSSNSKYQALHCVLATHGMVCEVICDRNTSMSSQNYCFRLRNLTGKAYEILLRRRMLQHLINRLQQRIIK